MNVTAATPGKHKVVGVGISTTSYEEVTECCKRWIDEKRRNGAACPGRYITVTSVHGIVSAFRDGRVREHLNGSDISTPDGMPVVWALRSFGFRQQTRVYGPDLMLALCAQAEAAGHSVFLYGAS